jgi:transcriptional regulator with XRE-family HTH domain
MPKYKKDTIKKYRYTAKEIAEAVGCSASYVRRIRQDKVRIRTEAAKSVVRADEFLRISANKLLISYSKSLENN